MSMNLRGLRVAFLVSCCALVNPYHARGQRPDPVPNPVRFWISDAAGLAADDTAGGPVDRPFEAASWLQETPFTGPDIQIETTSPLPPAAASLSYSLFGTGVLDRSRLLQTRLSSRGSAIDFILGVESTARVTTDAGNLLRKSPAALGIGVQRRTPIVNDPRVRGSRVGALPASGSYWVPARIDLDTMLTKIDSRIVDNIVVIDGPYSSMLGPGFHFVDVSLMGSPRFENGSDSYASTSFDYNTNGDQWYGRQTIFAGADDWGVRVGYGHRTGNDYLSGDNTLFPASYNSRNFDVALGMDLSPDRHLEFTLLRLDQTNVEFPGYAFDIDFLVTDGYEASYVIEDQPYFDRLSIEAWYNRTRFAGNAQNPGKRRQFPFLDVISYAGFTDVDSMSTGFRAASTWGCPDCSRLTAGVDLRFLKQELNEISSGVSLGIPFPFVDRNSPIPRSFAVNPGVFVEESWRPREPVSLTFGARADLSLSDIDDDPAKLAGVGLATPQPTYAEVVGTDRFQRNVGLWSLYLTGEYDVNDCWTIGASTGYAERPPTLTELYAAETFMFLLQNGLNAVTGDPRLENENLWQVDLELAYHGDRGRAGLRGFHAWAWDYITFENVRVVRGPPVGAVEQVGLRYVNTEFATLVGGEAYAEIDVDRFLTGFATMKYVEGRDHARNGSFATTVGAAGAPSARVAGMPRGSFSGVGGGDEEPLPGILPLEARVGVRLHDPCRRRWGIELAARIVDNQDRVAASLLETPTAGFTVLDARGYWRPTDRLLVVAGVENLTDRNYREHLDFRAPNGISVFQPGANFYFGSELTY